MAKSGIKNKQSKPLNYPIYIPKFFWNISSNIFYVISSIYPFSFNIIYPNVKLTGVIKAVAPNSVGLVSILNLVFIGIKNYPLFFPNITLTSDLTTIILPLSTKLSKYLSWSSAIIYGINLWIF